MTKTESGKILIREMTQQGWFGTKGRVMNDGFVTLDWFCKNRYFPMKESDWKEETEMSPEKPRSGNRGKANLAPIGAKSMS